MRIYIAGPMTGYPNWNYPAFFAAEEQLRAAGYDPINPARSFNGDTTLPYETYIEEGLRLVREEAEAILLLPGWEHSRGAKRELRAGLEKGVIVFTAIPCPLGPLVETGEAHAT